MCGCRGSQGASTAYASRSSGVRMAARPNGVQKVAVKAGELVTHGEVLMFTSDRQRIVLKPGSGEEYCIPLEDALAHPRIYQRTLGECGS